MKNKHKIGDKVKLRKDSRHYTGNYAGTEVLIKTVDSDLHCTVTGFDGKDFMCPVSYIENSDDFFKYEPMEPKNKCLCGAHITWGKECPAYFHSDFCPFYKPKED